MSMIPAASRTARRISEAPGAIAGQHVALEHLGVEERQRRLEGQHRHAGNGFAFARSAGRPPDGAARYAAHGPHVHAGDDHSPVSSDSNMPTATPSAIGKTMIAAAVATIRADSIGLRAADRRHLLTRTMRPATNSRIPASAASGMPASTPCRTSSNAAPRRRRRRPPTCERPPLSATMAVRGGLALTGKAPSSAGQDVGQRPGR